MKKNKTEELTYDSTAKISSKGSPILGHLEGPIADIIEPTRNGRKYSEELWEKVFNDPIIKEYFDCGGIFGEMNHPTDRQETDLTQVCICMPEPPEKKDGKLWGVFDILDTPNGRILKTLCDYGYKIGISSRGSGDVTTDYDGNESVDPDTYEFNGFDIVYLPAVKAARLDYMTESLNGKTFRQALTESLEKANDDERKIMEKTIDSLGINLKDESVVDNKSESPIDEINSDDIKEVVEEETVVDNKVDLVNELQENLKLNKMLENQIIDLQEKLSVCYAKENKQDEEINSLKESLTKLSETDKKVKFYERRNASLNEKYTKVKNLNESSMNKISSLETKLSKYIKNSMNLEESLEKTKKDYVQLKEKYTKNEDVLNETINKLQEKLEDQKNSYANKLSKSNELVEKYKNITTKVVNKYIDSQAVRIGVTSNEIKNRLPESYSLSDIDKVCEDLQSYRVTMNQLPFQTRLNENVAVKVAPKKSLIGKEKSDIADDVDDSLLLMARLK